MLNKRVGFSLLLALLFGAAQAEPIIEGKYNRGEKAFVQVFAPQNNQFAFSVNIFSNLYDLCSIDGTAKMIDSFRASAVYNDCFFVLSFKENYSELKIDSKGCATTCKGNVQRVVNGVYTK